MSLLAVEKKELGRLEDIIERGARSFVEVGNALAEIRDSRLYRETHDSFDAYCRERWSMGRNFANKMIAAAAVGTTVPVVNERQARELAPLLANMADGLAEETIKEIVTEAQTEGVVTASVLREKVRRVLPKKERKPKATRSDYNKYVDEEVIPTARKVKGFKNVPEVWSVYSQTTLKRHISVLEAARANLDEAITQAQMHLGIFPSK